MTPEDEEFERISREIRRNAAEDDDIQDYKKPWVGLTAEEIDEIIENSIDKVDALIQTMDKLKEKNF
jgi:hypothetical protein